MLQLGSWSLAKFRGMISSEVAEGRRRSTETRRSRCARSNCTVNWSTMYPRAPPIWVPGGRSFSSSFVIASRTFSGLGGVRKWSKFAP